MATGELVQSCKLLRRELNRKDRAIRSIEFIEGRASRTVHQGIRFIVLGTLTVPGSQIKGCLVMIINCLDLTATFIDSEKIPNCQTLLTALSFQLKAQGSAAEGLTVAPLSDIDSEFGAVNHLAVDASNFPVAQVPELRLGVHDLR